MIKRKSNRGQEVSGIRAAGDVRVVQTKYEGADAPILPLSHPFSPTARHSDTDDVPRSLLDSLRASERRVPLVGRDEAMTRAAAWLSEPPDSGPDHRVMVIHGPGGAGKTRLAAEIMSLAADEGWIAGFLSGSEAYGAHWARLSHPQERLILALDYAEARHHDLEQLFREAPVGYEGGAPLRVILIVREGKTESESWLVRFAGPRDLGGRAGRLLAEDALEVLSLEDSLPDLSDRASLWIKGREILGDDRQSPAYLANPLFERPLYVLLDAVGASAENHGGAEGGADGSDDPERTSPAPPTAADLLDGVLGHERNYWTQARTEATIQLSERQMNQVAVVATLVGGVAQDAFEDALAGLSWLRRRNQFREDVAAWWCSVYATSSGTVRGVEPDIVGEHQIVRAIGPRLSARDQLGGSLQMDQLASLVAAATLSGRQRILRVLVRIANDTGSTADKARAVLAKILSRHLDDFLPRTLGEPFKDLAQTDIGESVAASVASAIVACDKLELVTLQPGKPDPSDEEHARDTARSAAFEIVRRQVERVAERELDAGRWSIERFTEIVSWGLRCDPHARWPEREAAHLARVEAHQPRPHQALAGLYAQIARRAELELHLEEAEDLYQRALAELTAAGEQDTVSAYVIWHDLGDVAGARGDLLQAIQRSAIDRETGQLATPDAYYRAAIERYECALEGKARLCGSAHSDTVTTLLVLVEELAKTDLEHAFRRLSAAVEELDQGGVSLEESDGQSASAAALERIHRYRPRVIVSAARSAMGESRFAEAEVLYRRALEELGGVGEQDSVFAYIVWHDLGDVASAQGDRPLAVERYECALEGKTRLRGDAHPDTITTLLRLVEELAKTDPDRALQRLTASTPTLSDFDQLERVVEAHMNILAAGQRTDEATVVGRSLLKVRTQRGIRVAIFGAAADPGNLSYGPTPPALDGCLLARRVFPVGDPRLPALASRLAELIVSLVSDLMAVHIDAASALDSLTSDELIRFVEVRDEVATMWRLFQQESTPRFIDAMLLKIRDIAAVAAGPDGLFQEVVASVRGELEHALQDPLVASIRPQTAGEVKDLADDRELRRWLVRTIVDGPLARREDITRTSAGALIAFYAGLRLDVLGDPSCESDLIEIWTNQADSEAVVQERARLVSDLQTMGGRDAEHATKLVGGAMATAIVSAARNAESKSRLGEAEVLYRRALEELGEIGERDTAPAYVIWHDLGDVASARGDVPGALERYERALEGKTRLRGGADSDTITTLLRLVEELAKIDPNHALRRLSTAVEELDQGDASPEESDEQSASAAALERIHRYRPRVIVSAARSAMGESRFAEAEVLYRRALEELGGVGEQDSVFAYIIWHDLGDVASAQGDRPLAVERYECALEGKTRLRGSAHSDTITTLLRLLEELAKVDLEHAFQRLSAAAEELDRGGVSLEESDGQSAPAAALERIHEHRPRVILSAARNAEVKSRLGEAEVLYRRVLEELGEGGEQDSVFAYIVWHDLGDVASAQGDRPSAVERYERALDGKSRLYGPAHASTIATLLRLVEELAKTDPDRALRRLTAAARAILSVSGDRKDVRGLLAWLSVSSTAPGTRVTVNIKR